MANKSGITFSIKPTPALAESCQNLAAAVCGSDWFCPSPYREHPPLHFSTAKLSGAPLLFRDAIKIPLPAEEQFPAGDSCRRTYGIVEPVQGQHLGHLLTVTHNLSDAIAAGDVDSAGGADR